MARTSRHESRPKVPTWRPPGAAGRLYHRPVQQESVDGRRARRDRNTEAVVDAALALIAEGNVRPGVAEIAERSGVSPRSLFRYFDDLTELHALALERQAALVAHLFAPLDASGDRATRVRRFVDHRLHQHEVMGAYARAAVVRAPVSEVIRDGLRARRAALRRQMEALFEPELSRLDRGGRRVVADVIEAASAFEAIDLLRVERRRSRAATAQALTLAVEGALR